MFKLSYLITKLETTVVVNVILIDGTPLDTYDTYYNEQFDELLHSHGAREVLSWKIIGANEIDVVVP